MHLKTVRDWKASDLRGVRVLVRADFNVPIEGGEVGEDWRIAASLPTLRFLLDAGARVIVATHLGRPGGRRVARLSLRPVAKRLAALLRRPVRLIPAVAGPAAVRAVRSLRPGGVLMLENLRFHPGEEKNGQAFARGLAALADRYVDDAFGTAHRASASIVGVPRYLPSVAGFLLAEEVTALSRLLTKPAKPFFVLIGGVKIETKIGVIANLAMRATAVGIGGALAVPFLKARGLSVGSSPVAAKDVALARRLLRSRKNILLPTDVVVASSSKGKPVVRPVAAIAKGEVVYDVGPATVRAYAARVKDAKTIVWNGPVGAFETPAFSHGTRALALIIGARAKGRAYGVAGGGETIAALERVGVTDCIDWMSTGGGAMLAFLEGKTLPGIAALAAAPKRAPREAL